MTNPKFDVEGLRLNIEAVGTNEALRNLAHRAADHIEALTDALEELVDCQNGPPLPGRHEKHWRNAMDKANQLLGRDQP